VKYCYHCDRVTIGDPLFCNFCGRSFDVKLCPRLHVNPRGTRVCSKCGSSELTTPQPRVPFWAKVVLFLITLIPGIIVALLSIVLVTYSIRRFLAGSDMLAGLAATDFILGVLWWGWSEIPIHFRKTIRRWLQRHGDEKQSEFPK
jgi:RNA polymerase subunit RPABC4/transcription elongation factor Spt4